MYTYTGRADSGPALLEGKKWRAIMQTRPDAQSVIDVIRFTLEYFDGVGPLPFVVAELQSGGSLLPLASMRDTILAVVNDAETRITKAIPKSQSGT